MMGLVNIAKMLGVALSVGAVGGAVAMNRVQRGSRPKVKYVDENFVRVIKVDPEDDVQVVVLQRSKGLPEGSGTKEIE